MNRRQMFKSIFATAVAAVLPLPAILQWKERWSYSDIIRETLKSQSAQARLTENITRSNALLSRLHAHHPPEVSPELPVRPS